MANAGMPAVGWQATWLAHNADASSWLVAYMELLQVARLEQMFLQQVRVGAVVEALDVDVARDGAAVDGGAVERERAEDDARAGGGRELDALGSVDAVGCGVSDDLAAQLRERVEAAVGLRGRGQRLVVLRRAQFFFSSDLREQTERALPAALTDWGTTIVHPAPGFTSL